MLLTFEQAKQKILHAAAIKKTLKSEIVNLMDALDRINATDIISPLNVPRFDNSAMDGYAIRLSDLSQSNELTIAGFIFAGDDISHLDWQAASCFRIMTGAPVPPEADAVVMQENTQKVADKIQIVKSVQVGENIRRIGEDVKKGTVVVQEGQRLTMTNLMTAASLGIDKVAIYQPLKVALFSTGNELTPLGQTLLNNASIYDSNRFILKLLLKRLNCQIIDLGIIADDPKLIQQALENAASQADLIITSGGVSVGDADYTKAALQELGQIDFWKIAIKPGKPLAFGQIKNALFCGLPGNPVSALVTFYQLVQPLILSLSGAKNGQDVNLSFKVKAATDLQKTVGRLDFQRGILHANSMGELEVTAIIQQGSHITQSFHGANCFIVIEQDRGNVQKGEYVTVELFNSLLK